MFRKAKGCEAGSCVEVDTEMVRFVAAIGCGEGACVEVTTDSDGKVGIRDSKNGTDGPVLWFTGDEWQTFIQGVKNGEFDI